MKSKLFTIAWTLFKDGLFSTFADALTAAWSRIKICAKLAAGILVFQYTKTDGTIRTATGTTNGQLFNYENKGADRKENPVQVKYYDLDANGFRSFNINRLLSF